MPLIRPSSCIVKGGIKNSQKYLSTYLHGGHGVMLDPRPEPSSCLEVMFLNCIFAVL